jgi:hypothetical protein
MAAGVKFGRKRRISSARRPSNDGRPATLASIAKSYAVDLSMIFATSGLTPLDDRDADPVRYRQVVQRLLCHDQPAGEYLNRSIS